MKIILLCSILIGLIIPVSFVYGIEGINLTENQQFILNNTEVVIFDGITLKENSSLIIQNSKLMFDAGYRFNFSIENDASIVIDNSIIECKTPVNIRLKDNSKSDITNSSIYGTSEMNNLIGFGLSEFAKLTVQESEIGYIRLLGNSSISSKDCFIGELGIRTAERVQDQESTIQNISLYFQKAIITINGNLHGSPIMLSEKDIVTQGHSFSFNLNNTIIVNQPNIFLENGLLFLTNASLGSVNARENSGVEISHSNITSLTLEGYEWITLTESIIDELLCYNGDFDIDIRGSEISQFMTYMTNGLNLKVIDSDVEFLNLMYAHPDAPHNIEIIRTQIEYFYFKPGGPSLYQFTNSTIKDKISLELDPNDYKTPTFTGGLVLNENITINQVSGEGKTSLVRIYKIFLMTKEGPLVYTDVSVSRENDIIFNGKTDENGAIIFSVLFEKEYHVIEEPPVGGPYLVNTDDFSQPMRITALNHNNTFSFLSQTPLIIEIDNSEDTSDYIEDDSEVEEEKSTVRMPIVFELIGLMVIITLFIGDKHQANIRRDINIVENR